AAFASQLQGVGFGAYETIDLSDLDLMSSTFKRGASRSGPARFRLPAPERPQYTSVAAQSAQAAPGPIDERDKANALLRRAVDAKGGIDRLRALKTLMVKQTLTTGAAQAQNTMETTTYIQYPDRFRIETAAAGGANVQGFDGTKLWMKDQAGVHDLPEVV